MSAIRFIQHADFHDGLLAREAKARRRAQVYALTDHFRGIIRRLRNMPNIALVIRIEAAAPNGQDADRGETTRRTSRASGRALISRRG